MSYQPVSPKMDFPRMERDILHFWEKENCFQRLLDKNRGGPKWSFLDGPITANNPMGVHHAWGRTYKDMFLRYHAMLGEELRHQNGFDCQGLWVEVEVEKELGFQSKRDIEAFGVAEFVEKCKDRVRKYAKIQTEQSIRLGYWMDWAHSYYTMSDLNNYGIWGFLKKCHERGFLYQGRDVMPWCCRCGTGLSQHEIATEGYRLLTHTSVTIRLPIVGEKDKYFLVWTTTPWTLAANVAVAVHPDANYVEVEKNGFSYFLIKERLEVAGPDAKLLRELPGHELLKYHYKGPFDELEAQKNTEHKVIPWTEISEEEGTGIVHIAPGCGAEDFELSKEHNLDVIAPLDEYGVYSEEFGDFAGKYAGDVAEMVCELLHEKGILFEREEYTHSYPVCWRCGEELLFRLVDEWFISMEELRHEIMEATQKTTWVPSYGKDREMDWLQNMRDWMISKKRYWGLALPIYPCDCGRVNVIGSREELQERALEGWESFDGHSPHRPWIDGVKIACDQCGKPVSRVMDVGNPWLDAGIVPFSTMGYFEDPSYWQEWFPADLISESFPGQFRNWFYAILAMSTVMVKRAPFKTLFGYALMRDEKGREMHKSWGNSIEFDEAAEKAGVDAMRWLFSCHNPEQNLNFGYGTVDEARRRFLLLWNVYSFFVTYASLDDFQPSKDPPPVPERSLMDRWILSSLQTLIAEAHKAFSQYHVHRFMKRTEDFVNDLSTWYVRRSRRRFWKGDDDKDKQAAYETLYQVLTDLAKILAPIIPFATEAIYQNLVRTHDGQAPISIHLTVFPQADEALMDEELNRSMARTIQAVEAARAARQAAKIKVRQPLQRVVFYLSEEEDRSAVEQMSPEIRDELNVKEVDFGSDPSEVAEVSVHVKPERVAPRLGPLFPKLLKVLPKSSVDRATEAKKRDEPWILTVEGEQVKLTPEEFELVSAPKEGWAISEGPVGLAAVSLELTEKLVQEGQVRDIVRHVQSLRKESDFDVADRIQLRYEGSPAVSEAIQAFSKYLCSETLTTDLKQAEPEGEHTKEIQLGDETLHVSIEKA